MTLWNYALMSLGAVASDASHAAGHDASMVIDGNDLTYYMRLNSFGNWIIIDLGAPKEISQIVLYQDASRAYYLTALKIEYSDNGVDWSLFGQPAVIRGWTSIAVGPLLKRYWRFTNVGESGGYAWLYTIKIQGPVEAPPVIESPLASYVNAWLDSLDDNIRPIVDDWLVAHGYK